MLHKITKQIETDGSGDASIIIGSKIRGFLVAIIYTPGTLDTGTDLVFKGASSDIPILTVTNAGTSKAFYYPRAPLNAVDDASGADSGSEMIPLANEAVSLVVDEGGASKAGSVELIWMANSPY